MNTFQDINTSLRFKPAVSFTSCSLREPVKLRPYNGKPDGRKLKTIPQFFHDNCRKYKTRLALAFEKSQDNKGVKEWSSITYKEFEEKVEQAALLLLHLGVQPYSVVAILSYNCPEWFYVELGALCIGAVVTGIYTSNSAQEVYHVLKSSEAMVCLVDDDLQMSKVYEIKTSLTHLKAIIQIHGPFKEYIDQEPNLYKWKNLFQMKFDKQLREELVRRESNVYVNECALLIYTSGTTGHPKAAMLNHENILFCSNAMVKNSPFLQEQQEISVSYLPLNHVAAQIFDIFISIENGFLIYFADRNALKGTLVETYQQVKGTMMFGVPRVFEKMKEKFLKHEMNSSFWLRSLIRSARRTIENYHLDRMKDKPVSKWKYWLASQVVNNIKMLMGLGYIKQAYVGGAPLSAETKTFFLSLDLPMIDVFGLAESSGEVTINLSAPNLQTVGKPIEGMEIKIHKPNEKGEGEILLRGPSIFMGYLQEPQKTSETFTPDDWFKTGDLGYLDTKGYLYITGRLKELIITAGGENISPVYIEELIKNELPCLSNALVVGDQKKYLTVLLTFKTDINMNTGLPLDTLQPQTIQWLQSLNLNYTKLSELLNIKLPENLKDFDPNTLTIKCDRKVWLALDEGIKRYNEKAKSNAQKIQYFAILPYDFSIYTGELGPTLKIRRNIINQKYAAIIDKMYEN